MRSDSMLSNRSLWKWLFGTIFNGRTPLREGGGRRRRKEVGAVES
jgi:hypothetical protein